jgi:peptidoglycan/xylan/chitin deacetylase (PgdA/CDA1 family)
VSSRSARCSLLTLVLAVPTLALATGMATPAARVARGRRQGRTIDLPILMYHRIDPLTPRLPAITRRLTVTPWEFAAQMTWLESHCFHTLTQQQAFQALEEGARLPRRSVLITFDDGYRDVLGKASPVLARLHMHATAYVITGRVSGPDPSFLDWPQLHALERRGIEIGSHTVDHVSLDQLSDAHALAELRDSRAVLERRLGHPVRWFAYPFGAEDPRVVRLVRAAGYLLAVTTQGGREQSSSAPLELHRLEVIDTTTVPEFAGLVG